MALILNIERKHSANALRARCANSYQQSAISYQLSAIGYQPLAVVHQSCPFAHPTRSAIADLVGWANHQPLTN
ncbi:MULTISPECIES: hypothetical protein [unclassified Moorena]|uniref:hypothetical protein n=1 Tax=unclassified Moorena TaxID=2683338 RepID=UPI0025D8737D|nr:MULTISPECIES: hypothetical protein [unclassified Moorena]